jgi:hypothetical protein
MGLGFLFCFGQLLFIFVKKKARKNDRKKETNKQNQAAESGKGRMEATEKEMKCKENGKGKQN